MGIYSREIIDGVFFASEGTLSDVSQLFFKWLEILHDHNNLFLALRVHASFSDHDPCQGHWRSNKKRRLCFLIWMWVNGVHAHIFYRTVSFLSDELLCLCACFVWTCMVVWQRHKQYCLVIGRDKQQQNMLSSIPNAQMCYFWECLSCKKPTQNMLVIYLIIQGVLLYCMLIVWAVWWRDQSWLCYKMYWLDVGKSNFCFWVLKLCSLECEM